MSEAAGAAAAVGGEAGGGDFGGVEIVAPNPASQRRMSEMDHPNATVQGEMQLIDPEMQEGQQPEQPAEQMQSLEQDPNAPTPEAQLAEYRELMENAEIPMDKFGDKVIWYDSDGKGAMVPIRLKDVQGNILLYNDYQRKTTELAERNRAVERKENGQKLLIQDINNEDVSVGLRAWRAMMPEKQMENIVRAYVAERAQLESLHPALQQRFLAQQRMEDENFYLRRRTQRMEEAQQQQAVQQQQQQGVNAPDITFVQETISNTLPSVYQQLGISDAESTGDAFQYELGRLFEGAAAGQRNADGSWAVAPTIQRGRAPSRQLIQNIVLQAKQNVDKLFASPHARRLQPPRQQPPKPINGGTGPAALPGQRGNVGQPQRLRWSDMK